MQGDWLPAGALPEHARFPAGRGLNEQQAQASCIYETAELVSSCEWGDEQFTLSNRIELCDQCLPLESLLNFSDSQYANRVAWNSRFAEQSFVPRLLAQTEEISWTIAKSLDSNDDIYIPSAFAFIGHSEKNSDSVFCVGDSSGCAAGQSFEEAIINAFLELVERDATAIWWYTMCRRSVIDLTRVDSSIVQAISSWYQTTPRNIHVFDITTDLEIPVYAAVSYNANGRSVALGFGAHYCGEQALISALTEAIQIESSPAFSEEFREFAPPMLAWWLENIGIDTVPHLCPHDMPFDNLTGYRNDEQASVESCLKTCRNHQLKAYFIDFTREEIGVPVARVIVPKLCHQQARFGSDRLYHVPRKLGLDFAATCEAELTPFPIVV